MPNDWGFFGSTQELPFELNVSNGIATVTFADGVSFSFSVSISAEDVGGDEWHENSNRAEITKRYLQANIGSVLVLNPYELEDVWEALKDYPAIEFVGAPWNEGGFEALLDIDEYGDPVSTGSRTVVDGFGAVTHIVDDSKKVLVNATTPTHTLHEGYVCRHVFDDGNQNYFTLQSVGFGTGNHAGMNTFFSPLVWDHMTTEIIEGFASQKYADRTGQDTSRLIIAVP